MKKIMTLAAAAMACIVASASQIKWSTTATYQSGSDTALMANAAAYLIDLATLDQGTILAGMRGGKSLATVIGSDYVLKSSTGADGKVAALTGADDVYAGGEKASFYTVIVNADESEVFFSAVTANKTIAGTGATSVISSATASKNAAASLETAYSAAGWYTTQSIPEPTSGLLMLLGMAGLALRRRRA